MKQSMTAETRVEHESPLEALRIALQEMEANGFEVRTICFWRLISNDNWGCSVSGIRKLDDIS